MQYNLTSQYSDGYGECAETGGADLVRALSEILGSAVDAGAVFEGSICVTREDGAFVQIEFEPVPQHAETTEGANT